MRNRKRKLKKGAAFILAAALCCIIAVGVIFYVKGHKNTAAVSSGSSQSSASSAVSSSSGKSSLSASKTSGSTATGGILMLVNKDNPLPESYQPNFTTIPSKYYSSADKDRRFDSRAASALESFINGARAAGYSVNIISGYRTYQYQQNNFDRHVKQFEAQGETNAQAKIDAAKLVAPPGTSEHETGLAADIITSNWYQTNKDLTADFDKTPAFKWMYAHCSDYGFILRYPKDKVSITKYEYESWHYRYVGVAVAKKIMQNGLCLEEYLK